MRRGYYVALSNNAGCFAGGRLVRRRMNPLRYCNRRDLRILSHGFFHPGICTVCRYPVIFFRPFPYSTAMREYYRCAWCRSTPRQRAFSMVLQQEFPGWRGYAIHESSPGGAMSRRLERFCKRYIATNFHPGAEPGAMVGGHRNEDLQHQTFADNSFDLVATLDVMEHIPRPELAFREIARTLKPGGAHIFTVPCDFTKDTQIRAAILPGGELEHTLPPVYHGNPIDEKGSLVFRDWGRDMADIIRRACGLETQTVRVKDFWRGIEPAFNEVHISRKS